MIDDPVGILAADKRMYTDVFWYTAYMKWYDVTRSRDDLQLARMAANAAMQDIWSCQAPQLTLTEADFDALLAEGIDASFLAGSPACFVPEWYYEATAAPSLR